MKKRIYCEHPGDPLSLHDILLERVQFEDRRRHRNDPPLPLPKEPAQQSMGHWTPTALVAFGAHITKRTISILTP